MRRVSSAQGVDLGTGEALSGDHSAIRYRAKWSPTKDRDPKNPIRPAGQEAIA
jgi:hypothetical protein